MYRMIGAKDYLNELTLSNDHVCILCNDYKETTMYLFVPCGCVLQALNFGHLSYRVLNIPLNLIHVITNMYNFECTRSSSTLTIECFYNDRNTIYLEPEYVAKLQFRHSKFSKICCNFTSLLSNSAVVINDNQMYMSTNLFMLYILCIISYYTVIDFVCDKN